MPTVHHTDGTEAECDRVVVKEHGVVVGASLPRNKPEVVYPSDKVSRIEVDENVFDNSYLLEEEYGETRAAEPHEDADSVTEFKQERRVMSELHIE